MFKFAFTKQMLAGLVLAFAFLLSNQAAWAQDQDDDGGGLSTKSVKVCSPQWISNRIDTNAKAKTVSAAFRLNSACTWEVTSYSRPMLLPATFNGKGAGTIRIGVAQNTSPRSRRGTVTLSGYKNGKLQGRATLYIYQAGATSGKRSADEDDPDK